MADISFAGSNEGAATSKWLSLLMTQQDTKPGSEILETLRGARCLYPKLPGNPKSCLVKV